MTETGACMVTVYTKSARKRAKCGPFIYCGRPLVDGYRVCRMHLRGELRALEREAEAIRKALE